MVFAKPEDIQIKIRMTQVRVVPRAEILKHFHVKDPQINVYLAMDPI